MKYELKLTIYVDDKTKNADLTVDGVNNEGEECNFIFTDSKAAAALYNLIITEIYNAGVNAEYGVYSVKDALNDAGKALNKGFDEALEDHIECKSIRNGKFVDSDSVEKVDRSRINVLKDAINRFYDAISPETTKTQNKKHDDTVDSFAEGIKYMDYRKEKNTRVEYLKKAKEYLDKAIRNMEGE